MNTLADLAPLSSIFCANLALKPPSFSDDGVVEYRDTYDNDAPLMKFGVHSCH